MVGQFNCDDCGALVDRYSGCDHYPVDDWLGTADSTNPSDLITLLADIASNKEMILCSGPEDQAGASEPRKEMIIAGPARLVDALMDALTGG